jgi:hypothetical protein
MEKKKYTVPAIEIIMLDNEISLSMESEPPYGPDEDYVSVDAPENKNLIFSSSQVYGT